jgi:hypothetical protein
MDMVCHVCSGVGLGIPHFIYADIMFNLSVSWIGGLVHDAKHGPHAHLARKLLQMMLIFTLMMIALILPIRSFLRYRRDGDLVKAA